ncbi:MAG: hypothetical protein M3082_22165 [Candidatus Dormibacteraeota bacterium]|nr:hypothetical protein [Candidatus Dormibacteraeota bacterium]
MNAGEVLEQLDRCDRDLNFPGLANVNYPMAATRLTAFRSSEEWLLAFEVVAFGVKEGAFVDIIYAYGNRVSKPGWQAQVPVLEPTPGSPIWDRNGNFLLDLSAFEVSIRGKKRTFGATSRDRSRAGIAPGAEMPPALQLIRFLAFLIPSELLLSDEEILDTSGRQATSLTRFIQLESWGHPDSSNGQSPSSSTCLRALAEALASNNVGHYECPKTEHNTTWRHWDA